MEQINLTAIDLTTSKEVLSFPLISAEIDKLEQENDVLTTEHKLKSFSNPSSLTIECGSINHNFLSKLVGKMPDKYDIDYSVYVQVRKHKKKRINKKWAKRYGYKCVTKTTKGWKLKIYCDSSFEFIR